MSCRLSIENIYLLNLSLLITHEIDSAFWKEWELFGLPGGIQLFLLLNFVLVTFFLLGHQRVTQRQDWWKTFSWFLIAAGFIAVGLHGYFLAVGYPQFNQPASLITLLAILIGSITQTIVMIKQKNT
jgi:hypothetical protein